jgi:hypothetical protein
MITLRGDLEGEGDRLVENQRKQTCGAQLPIVLKVVWVTVSEHP